MRTGRCQATIPTATATVQVINRSILYTFLILMLVCFAAKPVTPKKKKDDSDSDSDE
jgi:hypothetical protein